LLNLGILGSNRLVTCIQLIALEGMALGVLPLLVGHDDLTLRTVLLAATSFVLKGIVFPRLLFRALRVATMKDKRMARMLPSTKGLL